MDSFKQSEVFVPGQVCQKKLPDLPLRVALPNVVVLNGLLVVCGKDISTTVCYKFDKAGTWDQYTTTTVNHDKYPGVALNGKLYVYNDRTPQIFDPAIQNWNNWEKPATRAGFQACMTVANGKIYLIGGMLSNFIQVFNPNAVQGQGWAKVADLPSMSYNMGCSVMATDTEIMITMNSSPNNVVIFDTTNNQFTDVSIPTNVYGSNLILMGSNNYLVGGGTEGSNKIYKYSPQSMPAWTEDTKAVLLTYRSSSGSVVMNASIFAENFLPSSCTGI